MIDALLYAVRDGIRAGGMNYGVAECEVRPDGKPAPRCGNWFVAVHGGKSRASRDNQLFEEFGFSVTLTARVTLPLDKVGEQHIARNLALVPLGQRQGFDAKVEQLRALIHMNWNMVVVQGRTPNSANDNIIAWATGTVYGFCEPMRYAGAEPAPVLVGGEWFAAEPDVEEVGLRLEMRFDRALRFQPQTAAVGPFV